MMKRTKILIISRDFPPAGSPGGVIRLVKLLKYADESLWEFVVFTEDLDKPVIHRSHNSENLLHEIQDNTEIVRIADPQYLGNNKPRFLLKNFGKSSIPWGISVLFSALKYIYHNEVGLIFASSPSFTNPLIGSLISKLSSLPFMIDMRDDWVDTPLFFKKKKIFQTIEKWFEKKIFTMANKITVVSPYSMENYTNRYPKNISSKIILIPNGTDLNEFDQIAFPETKNNSKFIITTAGQGFRKDYRDLTSFVQGFAKFVHEYQIGKENINVRFLGDTPFNNFQDLIEEHNLTDYFSIFPIQNRSIYVQELIMANLLFDTLLRDIPSAISGTFYDYWATGNAPILLISEVGVASKLLNTNNLGGHYYFGDIDGIASFIGDVYRNFINQTSIKISRNGIEKYDRKFIAKLMTDIWKEIL